MPGSKSNCKSGEIHTYKNLKKFYNFKSRNLTSDAVNVGKVSSTMISILRGFSFSVLQMTSLSSHASMNCAAIRVCNSIHSVCEYVCVHVCLFMFLFFESGPN